MKSLSRQQTRDMRAIAREMIRVKHALVQFDENVAYASHGQAHEEGYSRVGVSVEPVDDEGTRKYIVQVDRDSRDCDGRTSNTGVFEMIPRKGKRKRFYIESTKWSRTEEAMGY